MQPERFNMYEETGKFEMIDGEGGNEGNQRGTEDGVMLHVASASDDPEGDIQ